jgi:hypothetical protein
MNLKKFFITIFIVFSLNFSPYPITIYFRERNTIVMVQGKKNNEFTNDFTRKIEYKRFEQMISLYASILMIDFELNFYNSS